MAPRDVNRMAPAISQCADNVSMDLPSHPMRHSYDVAVRRPMESAAWSFLVARIVASKADAIAGSFDQGATVCSPTVVLDPEQDGMAASIASIATPTKPDRGSARPSSHSFFSWLRANIATETKTAPPANQPQEPSATAIATQAAAMMNSHTTNAVGLTRSLSVYRTTLWRWVRGRRALLSAPKARTAAIHNRPRGITQQGRFRVDRQPPVRPRRWPGGG